MKRTIKEVPGSFYLRGYIYWYSQQVGGKRYRNSTGQTDLESAIAWVKMRPFGSRTVRKALEIPHDFATRLWHQAKHNAKARKILFKLTKEQFHELYRRSNGHCAVTGLPFNLTPIEGCNRRPYAPSIDRITLAQGYTLENCRMVCAAVNLAMNDFGESVLWDIATSMVSWRKKIASKAFNATPTAHQGEEKKRLEISLSR